MRPPKILRDSEGTVLIERFTPIRRAEHILAIITFVLLVLTGFPQKYYGAGWARWLLDAFGGLDNARQIHRIAGLVFAGHAALHLTVILFGLLTRSLRLSLLPTPQDLRDAWNNLRYYLGYRSHPPPLPKFDYRQKFEYVGIVLGGLVMILTGLILLYPATVVSLFPGEWIPAARVAHSNEAMLALLVLVVWHVYGSHLSPDVFPADKSIFTGYMTLEELAERHALEFRRLFPDGLPEQLRHPSEDAAFEEAADTDAESEAEEAEEPHAEGSGPKVESEDTGKD